MGQEIRVIVEDELAEALDVFRAERDGLKDRGETIALILSLALTRYLPQDNAPAWQLDQLLSGLAELTVGEIRILLQGLGVLDHEFGAMGDLHAADRITAEAKLTELLVRLRPPQKPDR